MIKLPFILLSYITLFIVGFFTMEDVVVNNNTPAILSPGVKQLVEITVAKGVIQGFSKLELTLPVGFEASPAEIKGASFTFSGQKAKFVWMTLPSEENFTITYYIECTGNTEGNYEVDGTFSYVKDNKRVDFSIPAKTVAVKKDLAPTAAQAGMMPEIKKEEEFIEMVCMRNISRISDSELLVTLKVVNNNISGFGKILETVPENCKTEKINDGGAVVTQDKNSIKFVWFDVPTSNSFEVSYKVICISPVVQAVIKGQLSYTEDGAPIVINITQENEEAALPIAENKEVTTIPESVKEEEEFDDPGRNTITTTIPLTVIPEIKKPQTNDKITAENKSEKIPVTDIPSPEKGVTFKVQILAAHKIVNKTYFQDKFGFNEKFNIENHEGWVKYTTGRFDDYKEARDARENITSTSSKLPGPFVTAYSDGERITVQEALLINKQQWYK